MSVTLSTSGVFRTEVLGKVKVSHVEELALFEVGRAHAQKSEFVFQDISAVSRRLHPLSDDRTGQAAVGVRGNRIPLEFITEEPTVLFRTEDRFTGLVFDSERTGDVFRAKATSDSELRHAVDHGGLAGHGTIM